MIPKPLNSYCFLYALLSILGTQMRKILQGGVVFLFFLLVACSSEKKTSDGFSSGSSLLFFKKAPKVISVVAYKVISKEVPLIITAPGKTQASNRFEAKVSSETKIEKVFVEEGALVQAGDPLIKFNAEERRLKLNKARAEIREAEAGIASNATLLKNKDELLDSGKLIESEAESLEEKNTLYEATMDRAKAEIELYESEGDMDQINSPITGLVTKRNASEGTEAKADEVLIEVVQLDPLQFLFTAPVSAITAIAEGTSISIHFPAISSQEFTGELLTGSEVDPQTGGVDMKVKIPNPSSALKAEMRGEVVIHTQGKKKVYPILESALLASNIKSEKSGHIFKIVRNKVKRTAIELSDNYNGQPAVEKGLSEGDLIVASPDEDLNDGGLIEIQRVRTDLASEK